MFELTGRRAVITGASRGIGRAIAVHFASQGADVLCVARSEPDLKETVSLAEAAGGGASLLVADFGEEQAALAVVEHAVAQLGGVDILVNNAAADHMSSVVSTDTATWQHVMDVDLRAPFLLSRAAGPYLLEQGHGKVINLSSVLGGVAIRDNAAYIAAKTGLIGFTRALALEWARSNVQVNALAPGFIRTEMTAGLWETDGGNDWVIKRTPAGRWGEVEDIARAAVFLASEGSDFMTGQTLVVDGGWTAQ